MKLKVGDKFKLGANKAEVHSIDLDKDKVFLLITDWNGMTQLHTEGFGLKWVEEGFDEGVNTIENNLSLGV